MAGSDVEITAESKFSMNNALATTIGISQTGVAAGVEGAPGEAGEVALMASAMMAGAGGPVNG